jgi:hypothetical protein
MKLDERAAGIFAIASTPFLEDGSVDDASLDRVTDFLPNKGRNLTNRKCRINFHVPRHSEYLSKRKGLYLL